MSQDDNLPIQCELFPESTRRDQQELMVLPFAAFSTQTKEIEYEAYKGGQKVQVQVTAGPNGIASVHDFDIILFCASAIQKAMNEKGNKPRTVTFTRKHFLKWANRTSGGTGYQRLEDALDRLASTFVKTTLREDDRKQKKGFTWIDYDVVGDSSDHVKPDDRVTVALSHWLWKGIVDGSLLLKIDPEYFSIVSSYQRFLYRMSRKSIGHGNFWSWKMEELHERAGTNQPKWRFAQQVRRYTDERDDLPRYKLTRFDKNSGPEKIEWVRAYDRSFYRSCLNGDSDIPPPPSGKRGG